jgi:NAD-dependent dihydropyrimidine dehydrogenase PreA subunit
MAYVITEPCIDVMDKSCIEECPVDCIKPGKKQMLINPYDCIDCGACQPVCPVSAIYYENDVPENYKNFIQINKNPFIS